MDYKDKDNILLIICGAVGMAALALVFRYLFLISFKFDSFGANVVFVTTFVLGMVLYITYLEFIQNTIFPIFNKRYKKEKQPIEQQNNSELEPIRQEHSEAQIQKQTDLLEKALHYTRNTLAPYLNDDDLELLCNYLSLYAQDKDLKEIKPSKFRYLSFRLEYMESF